MFYFTQQLHIVAQSTFCQCFKCAWGLLYKNLSGSGVLSDWRKTHTHICMHVCLCIYKDFHKCTCPL